MTQNYLDVENLRHGLALLPQELYELIYNTTFTASFGTRYLDDNNKRQSLDLLHVSSASRAQYAESYYHATFELHWNMDLFKWLESLPEDHRIFLIKVIKQTGCTDNDWSESEINGPTEMRGSGGYYISSLGEIRWAVGLIFGGTERRLRMLGSGAVFKESCVRGFGEKIFLKEKGVVYGCK